jgi:hypothetical protein
MLRWLPTRSLVKCVQFSGNSTNGLHTCLETLIPHGYAESTHRRARIILTIFALGSS